MKKTLTLCILLLAFCISLTACGGLLTQEDLDNAVNSATADLNAQIAAIEADIAEKTARIATLEAEKTELGADIEELDAEVAALEAKKSELESENEALKNCLAGKHNGGTATCTEKAVCVSCNNAYGELNPDNHTFVDSICACGLIDATEMTADQLNTAVAKMLASGETDFGITLAPDAPAKMITAIRRAICDTEGVADGSINLTLKGVTYTIKAAQ